MNVTDEPRIFFQGYYEHLDRLDRIANNQARHIANAISSACFLMSGCRTGDERAAVLSATTRQIQVAWRQRIEAGLTGNAAFKKFWDLVIYKSGIKGVETVGVCRSHVRDSAIVLEVHPAHTVDAFVITIDP
jgi:hypothetical protein